MSYLLTVSRMDLSKRRQRWSDPAYKPAARAIGTPESPIAYGGLLVLVDDAGQVRRTVSLDSPKGLLWTPAGLLVACFGELRLVSADLAGSTTLASEPWCNDLHSLRPAPGGGVLVAAAGVDAAFELTADGATRWCWWAADHGFDTDRAGESRLLDRGADHRRVVYPVEWQSTHVNAVAAAGPDMLLATLFQRNMLVSIDRASGATAPLLGGLGRPHAVRVDGAGLVSLADTAAGAALLGRLNGGRLEVIRRIEVRTPWLHDAYFDGEHWLFVDGAASRVLRADAAGNVLQVDSFDPDWCLYEVLPWGERDLPAVLV